MLRLTKLDMVNIDLVVGEVKPSVDGEKERNEIRHGDYESTPGTIWVLEMTTIQFSESSGEIINIFVCRKKGDNVEHGLGRKLILISTKRL